jgi:hypothetical protein
MSPKVRLSASVDADLVAAAEAAVASGRSGSVSAWVNDALELKRSTRPGAPTSSMRHLRF